MSRPRPGWDFGYAPSTPCHIEDELARPCDVIVALHAATSPSAIEAALAALAPGAGAAIVIEPAPMFWLRVRAAMAVPRAAIAAALTAAGLPLRYVAAAAHAGLELGPALDLRGAPRARPDAWRARKPSSGSDPVTPGRWFLRAEGGVAVDRRRFGGGAGTRLAVIDDDALGAEEIGLDAEVCVGIDSAPRHQAHGPLLVAWAVGAPGFRGVAPDASPRLYLIPKPGVDVVSLPLAIVRAASDGADVIVCATYVEGSTSPMLDDALELAVRLGRRGRGAAVLFPTGRDASSAPGSTHPSFSLDLAQPACDPRVFCVAPGGRDGGWFTWIDRRGRARPFANRGPSVRWLAPGDDVTYPFAAEPRLFHAESSGASAIAAGALLLVLAASPTLTRVELEAVLTSTLDPPPRERPPGAPPLADPRDALPDGRDRDGHDAKHGYGRLDAGRACLAASDPIAATLVAIGEDELARAILDALRSGLVPRPYSRRLGRWAARALLADPAAAHALRAVVRHLRLIAGRPDRLGAHTGGAMTRQIAQLARHLAARARPRLTAALALELEGLARLASSPATDARIAAAAAAVIATRDAE
ncbi:MAG: hypothetical protein ACMG6S_17515 [Byssovorax sp.]